MKRFVFLILLSFLVYSCNISESNKESNAIGGTPLMQIETTENDYINLLENKLTDFSVPCRLVYLNKVYNGKISASGSGSRYHDKWGYKVKLEYGETIRGLNEFNLSSQIYDKTGLSILIATQMYLKLGFPVNSSNYTYIKFNGIDKGLYPIVERVEEQFFSDRNMPVNELYKIGFETKFTFSSLYIPEYNIEKKIPDDNNFNSLKNMINALDTADLTNSYLGLNKYLDVKNYIKYHAITVILNNQDAFTNNFFLYKAKPNSPFTVIPWDFDKCFIGNVGIYGENEIIAKLKSFPLTKKLYLDTMKDILTNIFTESEVFFIIEHYSMSIKDAYKNDPYLGKNGYIFEDEVNKLKQYIIQRRNYLLNQIELEY
ncbi:MAG TPA: CotH kinase family protein [Melioribacteraceae bacterium]|nr:CotH kinase family protein [Melioribacteraceae bacterium]